MAALTGSERGLPAGSFLNDTVEAGPDTLEVSVVWQPFEDEASLVKLCCFCLILSNSCTRRTDQIDHDLDHLDPNLPL